MEPDDKTVQKVALHQPAFYLVKSDIDLNELIKKIKSLLHTDSDKTNTKT
jgi:hypothetical protein